MWTQPSPGRSAQVAGVALALAAAFLLVPAAILTPRTFGDSAEYLLTAESLMNHATPELRATDLASMTVRVAAQPVEGGMRALSAYRPGRKGALYAQHFWAYPAVTLPVRALLRWFGMHEYKAFPLTNALLLLGAAALCLSVDRLPPAWRLLGAGLLVVSPLALFAMLPHTEVFCASLIAASLCWWRQQAWGRAVLAAAVATLQSPPLGLLVVLLWCAAVKAAGRDHRRVLRLTLCALIAAMPYVFNLWAFGRPSLIADENIHAGLIRPGRALEILYDLNIGLVRAAPLTVALALAVTASALLRGAGRGVAASLWALVVGVALVCSGMADWNHGTSGPSRYALWILPLLVATICDLGARLRSRLPLAVGWIALAVQGLVFIGHGGFTAPEDYLQHSWAARAVLDRWPALYSPSHEIFAERTLHMDERDERREPVIYAVGSRCRKAFAQKRHAGELLRRCGTEPPGFARFRGWARDAHRRETWTYVDY